MATSNLNFRLATPADAASLETLINTAFRDDKTTQVFLHADHAAIDVTSASALAAKMGQPNCATLVATTAADPASLVAHCSVRMLEGRDRVAWLGLLAVDVGAKNTGLGSRLLAHAEEYARREWAAARMEFDVVNTRADLIAWYERRGYKLTGDSTPFPYEYHGRNGDWRTVLRDDLSFIHLGKDL